MWSIVCLVLATAGAQPRWLVTGQEITVSGQEGQDQVEFTLLAPGLPPQSLGYGKFEGQVNPAKMYLQWRGQVLEVTSQMPFSAFGYVNEYNFERREPRWTRAYTQDPSLEMLNRVRGHLKRTEIDQAQAALEQVLYPHHYYQDEPMALEFLLAGHRGALDLYRRRRVSQAVALMEKAIRPFQGLVENWPWQALVQPKGVVALNDYGYFLEQNGQAAQAVEVLQRVVLQDPQRTPAYLNLADAQVRLGQRQEARKNFKMYVQQRQRQELPVPDRVWKFLKD